MRDKIRCRVTEAQKRACAPLQLQTGPDIHLQVGQEIGSLRVGSWKIVDLRVDVAIGQRLLLVLVLWDLHRGRDNLVEDAHGVMLPWWLEVLCNRAL